MCVISFFSDLLKKSNLMAKLNSLENFTLFLPSNQAINEEQSIALQHWTNIHDVYNSYFGVVHWILLSLYSQTVKIGPLYFKVSWLKAKWAKTMIFLSKLNKTRGFRISISTAVISYRIGIWVLNLSAATWIFTDGCVAVDKTGLASDIIKIF